MLTSLPATIAVCPLRRLDETIAATGARHVISVVNSHLMPPTPYLIEPSHHLRLPISEARTERGIPNPMQPMIEDLIAFTRAWEREAPLLIHCFSGLNRSPAAAYIALAALNPAAPETLLAHRLRAASEMAAPNGTMVGVGDLVLGRGGKLASAIDLIGPGVPAAECVPFSIVADFTDP